MFKRDDQVWYRPANIGYGYAYGKWHGIPAQVTVLTPKRVRIVFLVEGTDQVVGIAVSAKNLEIRHG